MLAVNLKVEGRLALVLGGGRVGLRKLKKLLAAGASACLVEPNPGEEVMALIESGRVMWRERFSPELWEGASLVFLASSDAELNRRLAEEALARGLWVNAADAPELSNFFLPAVLERGEFSLSVSTGGAGPAFAARTVRRLAEEYGPAYGDFCALLGRLRGFVLASGLGADERAEIFRRLADSNELFRATAVRDEEAARRALAASLSPLTWSGAIFETDNDG